MIDHPLNPQIEYEMLADALQRFQAQGAPQTAQTITALQEAVARAAHAWWRCEPLRATREKEFRYHVIRLKLLVAGVAQTLDALPGGFLSRAA